MAGEPYNEIVYKAAETIIAGTGTTGASAKQVQGAVASGSANAANPVKTGVVFNTTRPTVTSGQVVDTQSNGFGVPYALSSINNVSGVDGIANSGVGSFSIANVAAPNAGSVCPTVVAGYAFNGSTWDRMRGDASNGLVVQSSASEYETVAASQTDQILGATGAVGDLVDSLLIIPATTSPGNVQIKDGNGTAITVFTGGASSVSSLVPFSVPLGLKAVNATTPGWKVTTGANVSVIGIGNFT